MLEPHVITILDMQMGQLVKKKGKRNGCKVAKLAKTSHLSAARQKKQK